MANELIFYRTPDGDRKIEVVYQDENFWLSQKLLAELFQKDVRTISEHIRKIFDEKELEESSVIRKFRTTASDGKKYKVQYYNLDAIIAVGYRVNSYQATQFRIWATKTLKEFIIKGFVLDDERLKQGKHFGKDYFDELLERIREIRASERRFYQKITDIYLSQLITINTLPSLKNSLPRFKTNSTGPLLEKPQQKSFMNQQMLASQIWVSPLGSELLKAKF